MLYIFLPFVILSSNLFPCKIEKVEFQERLWTFHLSFKVEYLTVISNIGSFVGRYLIVTALIVNRCMAWGRVRCKTLQVEMKRAAEQCHVTQESQKKVQ